MDQKLTNTSDHDLLIVLNENVQHMRDEMRVSNQLLSKQVSDHEVRLRVLEADTNSETGSKVARKEMSNNMRWLFGALIAVATIVEPVIMLFLATKK